MAKRAAPLQTKARAEARPWWPDGRTLAAAGLFLPALAGAGELPPRLLLGPWGVGATAAAHVWLDEPMEYERQELEGFSLEVPKGWARNEGPGVVSFEGQAAGIRVRMAALHAPSESRDALGVANSEVKRLGGGKPAKLRRVKEVSLPTGRAVLLKFRVDPEPAVHPVSSPVHPVSSLECSVYVFSQPGRLRVVSVWSPTASDHRALRQRVAESLRWK